MKKIFQWIINKITGWALKRVMKLKDKKYIIINNDL